MKKILLTVLAVIMAGALIACGQSGQVEETKETVQEEGTEQITEEAAIDLESEPEETQVVLETEETGNDIEALEEDSGFPILDEIAKNVQVGTAGCEDAAYPWSDSPVESIEAVMEAIGLR